MGEHSLANRRGGGGVDAVSTGGAVGNDRVVRRTTSYWLVLAKSGGGTAGAVGGTCCPGGDGGAASWAVFLWPGDLALAARAVRRCVPGRQSVAGFALHASRKWPRAGKSPVRGKIRVPCIRKRAGSGKICALCIRKAPQTAFRERTARRSCQEGPLFAARAPRITHGAQILPSFGA